jgi:hypothetical protein
MGDALEYIVQTQSLVFDQSISINRETRAQYWNKTNPFELTLEVLPTHESQLKESNQAGGGFGSLYPSKNSSFYYVHSWIYSLVASPSYYIFNLLSLDEYRSFQFFNCVLLAIILSLSSLTLCIFILCSPIAGYVYWSCPEVFQFFCLAIGFNLLEKRRYPYLAISLIGLAGAQNFPSIVFLITALFIYRDSFQFSKKATLLRIALIFILATFPWILYSLTFGTSNLIVGLNQANLQYSSLERLSSYIFSPVAGALFYFPVAFILLPLIEKKKALSLILIILSLAYAMTSMANLHSQQIACPRYFSWLLAPLYGILLSYKFTFKTDWLLLFSISALILFNRNYLFLLGEHPRSGYLLPLSSRAAFIYRNTHYPENPEVLAEIALGKELRAAHEFNRSYEIPLGNNQSICLISRRAYKADFLLRKPFLPAEVRCGELRKKVLGSPRGEIAWSKDSVLGQYLLSYE